MDMVKNLGKARGDLTLLFENPTHIKLNRKGNLVSRVYSKIKIF